MNKIAQFWNWFKDNENKFGEKFENRELLSILDVKIREFGKFNWEIGPGKIKKNALVISPNGDVELLSQTKKIITQAKDSSEWEFHYAIPPKDWDLRFNFITQANKKTAIDASKWKYVLFKYEDGVFEIIIEAPGISQFCDTDRSIMVDILLNGILGEETRLMFIDAAEITEKLAKQYQNKASFITHLAEYFHKFGINNKATHDSHHRNIKS